MAETRDSTSVAEEEDECVEGVRVCFVDVEGLCVGRSL